MVQVGNDKSLNFHVAGFREDPLYQGILGVGTPSLTKVCLTVDRYNLPTLLSVPVLTLSVPLPTFLARVYRHFGYQKKCR